MGETTGIAWASSTWNPWMGCRKVSAGCAHCYAEKLVRDRMGKTFTEVRRTGPATWKAPLKWDREAAATGQRWFAFTCSLSDFFIEEADPWRDEAWRIIRDTPHLIWQALTKRPERIKDHLPPDWGGGYPNVWLGTSVENANHLGRAMCLSEIPCRVHFISAEPLLGSLQLDTLKGYCIDWAIVGGESGPGARPMDPDWAREIRDQCAEDGVPFFLKQLGGHPDKRDHEKAVIDGRTWTEMPG